MMNVLGEREKEKPCEFDFTRLFSSLMRIFDFGFSSYFRLDLDISCLVDIIITQSSVNGKRKTQNIIS